MSALESFISGSQYGTGLRKQKEAKEIGALASIGNYGGAKQMAMQTGNTGAANDIQGMMAKMDEQTAAKAAENMKLASGAASGILDRFGNDPEKAYQAIQSMGPSFGIPPEMIAKAQQDPIGALVALVGQNEKFQEVWAKNQENFTLSKDQQRFGADGSSIASNVHQQTVSLGDRMGVFDPASGQFGGSADIGATHGEVETARHNQASENNTRYANQTGRMNAEKPTATIQEWQQAVQGGYEGSFMEYKQEASGGDMTEYQRQSLDLKRQELDRKTGEADQATSDARKGVIEKATEGRDKIKRLLAGDLKKGLKGAYGKSGVIGRRIPGSKAKDAYALVQEVVGPKTLDELAKMKGVPSDRDIDLVKGAATSLNDPGISDDEAILKLNEIDAALERILKMPDAKAELMGGEKGITKAEFNKLPSGAKFTAPDGTVRIKP